MEGTVSMQFSWGEEPDDSDDLALNPTVARCH